VRGGARRRWLSTAGFYVLAGLFMLPTVFVFYWMITLSLKPQIEATAYPPSFVRFSITAAGYREVFTKYPFFLYTWNSLVVATGCTLLGLAVGLPAAYSIAHWRQQRLAVVILVARIIPGIAYLIPWYIFFRSLRMVDTYGALILTHLIVGLPIIIWVMISFFEDLPADLEDAALIDGCSHLGVFWRIALPLVKPGVVATAILSFVFSWNNFLFSVILAGRTTRTLPIAVYNMISYEEINWGTLAAAATLITLPVLLVALLAQRHIVTGLTFGVHHVEGALPGEDTRYFLAAAPGHLGHGGRREVGGVGRGDDVVHRQERVVGRDGLLLPHVERGAGQALFLERTGEGLLVHHRAARGVDQDRGRLHAAEERLADEVARLGIQQRVNGNVIRALGERLERYALDAEGGEARRRHVGVAGDDLRLEGGHPSREGAADVAQADDADRLPVQRAGTLARHRPAPRARVDLAVERDDLAVPGQEQREGVVGDLAHPDVGNVHDDHAQLGGGGHVDDVVAHAGAHHGLEALERAHHAAGDRRGRDDERVGVARPIDHLLLLADEGQRGHPGGDVGQRGLAVGVIALAASLDDVDVIGSVGHVGSVQETSRKAARKLAHEVP